MPNKQDFFNFVLCGSGGGEEIDMNIFKMMTLWEEKLKCCFFINSGHEYYTLAWMVPAVDTRESAAWPGPAPLL